MRRVIDSYSHVCSTLFGASEFRRLRGPSRNVRRRCQQGHQGTDARRRAVGPTDAIIPTSSATVARAGGRCPKEEVL